jgi:outer membrane protein OmpA-like peptidoglycan-associated protein
MTRWQKIAGAFASLVLASGIVLSATAPSRAQAPTVEQILNALKPAPILKTRGLTTDQSRENADERRFIDKIRTIKTRGLDPSERQRVSEIAKSKPNIDLEVYFDYDSSAITPRAESDLITLGKALTSPELKGSAFVIGGHTDAKGDDDYNQKLSERRAASVKRFLKQEFDIADDTLVTVGYGEEQLKNTSEPLAAENRRVQIVNLEQKTAGR